MEIENPITMDERPVTVKLYDKLFVLKPVTWKKIPYIGFMVLDTLRLMNDDGILNPITVDIDRSPTLFEKVVAFVNDPLYPFPLKYYTELDFYDIVYKKDQLYDKDKVVMNEFIVLKDSNTILEKHMKDTTIRLNNIYNHIIERDVCDICKTHYNPPYVNRCKCKRCLISGCNIDAVVKEWYCNTHRPNGSYCVTKGCYCKRYDGMMYCIFHANGII